MTGPAGAPTGGRAGQPHVLAVDLGTSAVKVALVGLDGTVTGWADHPLEVDVLPAGGAEQDPEEWWAGLVAATSRLGRDHPEALRAVEAVCCSTQGEGTVAVDRHGTALTRCVLWMDMRGAPHLRRQFGGPVRHRGLSVRRLARWIRLTGGCPSPTGKDPAAHMLLVRDELPEVYARTHRFLNVLDYLNLRLTGRFVATWDSILTSWVTDNRDPSAIRYARSLVADCGVDADKLPELVPSTEVLGTLTPQAADELGLDEGVRVVAGAIDTSAAAVGAGTIADRDPHLYLGTSSWIAAHVPDKRTDVRAGLASVPCAVPGRYLLTALQATAGGNITFLRDNVLYHTDALYAEAGTDDVLELLSEVAEQVPSGANGVIYTPWIHGERAPVDDLTLRAGLFNVSLSTTRADLIRAFYEGVALNTRWLAGAVDRFLGEPMEAITVVGGGATSEVWCRIFADVLGIPVTRTAEPTAANARGAAWIAAVGLGRLAFDDVPDLVAADRRFEPDPGAGEVYDEAFATFLELHRRLAPLYQRLARRAGPGRPAPPPGLAGA